MHFLSKGGAAEEAGGESYSFWWCVPWEMFPPTRGCKTACKAVRWKERRGCEGCEPSQKYSQTSEMGINSAGCALRKTRKLNLLSLIVRNGVVWCEELTRKGEISEFKMCWLLWRQRIEIIEGRIVMLVSNPEADRKAPSGDWCGYCFSCAPKLMLHLQRIYRRELFRNFPSNL